MVTEALLGDRLSWHHTEKFGINKILCHWKVTADEVQSEGEKSIDLTNGVSYSNRTVETIDAADS